MTWAKVMSIPSTEAPGRDDNHRMELFMKSTTILSIVARMVVMPEKKTAWGSKKTES